MIITTQEEQEDTEWWCPTEQRWCLCPGPCPDGTEHSPSRTYMHMVTVHRSDIDGPEANEEVKRFIIEKHFGKKVQDG